MKKIIIFLIVFGISFNILSFYIKNKISMNLNYNYSLIQYDNIFIIFKNLDYLNFILFFVIIFLFKNNLNKKEII